MSTWDDYFNSFKDITGSVIERTGKLMDVSRLKLTSTEISKEITRRYEALGRVVYDSAKAGTDITGLINECVRSIDALYGRLDDVNSRVADLRDKKYCAGCGAVVDKGSLFCSRCGSRVETEQERKRRAADDNSAQKAAEKASRVVDDVIDKAKKAAEDAGEYAADIAEKAKEAAGDAKEALEKVFDKAEDAVCDAADKVCVSEETLEDMVNDAAESAEEAIEDVAENVSDAVDDIEEKVSGTVEDAAEKLADSLGD